MEHKPVIGMLGLATRAGALVSGDYACEKLLRAGQAAFVMLDAAASDNSRKRYEDACSHRNLPLYTLPEGALGHAIGKPGRMAAAVKPGELSSRLQTLLNEVFSR